jgi:F-type H+-transporting ATPase subunit epsilon
MRCIVVTPEKTVLSQEVTFVVLPLVDGEWGVMPNHAPLIGRLGTGELRLTDMDGQQTYYYVEGGFAEIHDNTISLLTMCSYPAQELDLGKAEAELAALPSPMENLQLSAMRQSKIDLHRAKVRVARKATERARN